MASKLTVVLDLSYFTVKHFFVVGFHQKSFFNDYGLNE